METIKQYLESLFISMPNTSEVYRAKTHLLEMAEDKYQNLLAEGMNDNEAVAKVIAEFGNLDELKEDLGLDQNTINENVSDARPVTLDEIKELIHDFSIAGIFIGLGVFCFICCVVSPILIRTSMGPIGMFISIAVGVGLCVIGNSFKSRWNYIRKTKCCIDMNTADYVKSEYKKFKTTDVAIRTVAILLIALCFVPAIGIHGAAAGASLFLMIGSGVALLIITGTKKNCLSTILAINPQHTIGGSYSKGSQQIKYKNKTVETIMGIYWPLITCIYLSVSFLSHAWATTWIIWPIAAILTTLINAVWGEEE